MIKSNHECDLPIKIEEWKQLDDFGGCLLISSHGRCIKTFRKQHILAGSKMLQNGKRVPLFSMEKTDRTAIELTPNIVHKKPGGSFDYKIQFNDPMTGKKQNIALGLLIANHFLPNPLNRKRVMHKDGNRMNCHIDNLLWKSEGSTISNKEEYFKHLRNIDIGERKSSDVCDAIIQYLEGDNSKIEELLQKHRKKIFWAIHKIVQRKDRHGFAAYDVVDDLTQEAMLKIYQKINDLMFHSPKNPVGWFIRIAQNVSRNFKNQEKRDYRNGKKEESYNPEWNLHQVSAESMFP